MKSNLSRPHRATIMHARRVISASAGAYFPSSPSLDAVLNFDPCALAVPPQPTAAKTRIVEALEQTCGRARRHRA